MARWVGARQATYIDEFSKFGIPILCVDAGRCAGAYVYSTSRMYF